MLFGLEYTLRKLFLLVFGLYGFAAACLQGLVPLIELSHWVAWFTENWVAFTRMFWGALASFLGWSIPERIADFATSIAYTASLFIGYRRLDYETKRIILMPSQPFGLIDQWLEKHLPKPAYNILRIPVSIAIFWQYFLVIFLLYLSSPFMAYAVFAICALIGFADDLLPTAIYEKVLRIVMPQGESLEEKVLDEQFATAFLVTSGAILVVLLFILALNEISVHADNIISAYNWARCEAGIHCAE